MQQVIYGLYDPRVEPRVIRYVGYTKKGGEQRLKEHVQEARLSSANVHKLNWIRSLVKDGVMPQVVELEQVTNQTWKARERFWISHFGRAQLVNSTDGGEGLINPSQDVKDRIGKASSKRMKGIANFKGHKHTEESRKKTSESMKIAESLKTEEQKQAKSEKLRVAKLGVKRIPFSKECRLNMRNARVGFKVSEETKKKNGDIARGRKFINDGVIEKFIHLEDGKLPDGWKLGRVFKKRKKVAA